MAFAFAGFYTEVFENENRALLRNEPVTVYLPGTTTEATLYSSRAKATQAANPFSTDEFGNGSFFADPGEYDLLFNGFTTTVTVPIDPEEAAQDTDLSAYATTVSLTAEAAARALADEVLADGLDDETADRTTADTAEATARTTADASLAADIVTGDAAIETHRLDTTAVHGIIDTSVVETTTGAQAKVDAAVAALIDSAPGALDTLNELAAAFGDDPNFAATVTNALAAKLNLSLYDANSILAADTDDTPTARAIDEDRIVGRQAGGNIGALTATQVRAILAILEDAAAGTASLRTLGTGGAQALPGNHPVSTTADVTAEATARTTADNLRQLLSEKGAASGYMGLDAASRGAQTPKKHAALHAPGGDDEVYSWHGSVVGTRVESCPRLLAGGNAAVVAGTVYFSYLTAPQSLSVSQLLIACGSTAGVGITLARLGLYAEDGAGDLTLVARTAADATILASANSVVTRSLGTTGGFPAAYQINRGSRYALALVVVGATVQPSAVHAMGTSVASVFLTSVLPFVAAVRTGQSDLPATVAAASLTLTSGVRHYWMAAS